MAEGFLPLPHPFHSTCGQVFPKEEIDAIKRQDGRDRTRSAKVLFGPFPLAIMLLIITGCMTKRLLTPDDTVEFFNLVLGDRLTAKEKRDLVAFMRPL
jgi:hypothetical protein